MQTPAAMRVLFLLTDGFGGYGGIAKFNRDLLIALSSFSGVEEIVAIPRLMDSISDELPPKVTHRTNGLGSRLRYVRAVMSAARRDRFDVITCGHINLLPLAAVLQAWLDIPLVLILHGVEAWKPTGSRINDRLVRRVDRFIAVSETTKARFVAWSKVPDEKGFLLPNSIDVDRFGLGPKDPELVRKYELEGKTVVMTLGRLSAAERAKGIDEMLEVLPDLVRRNGRLVYLVAGGGDDLPRLTEKAKALGVADQVRFTGYIDEARKDAYYRLADAFVMPSRGEGFGIVHLEAMACGIPVVASKLDGSREAVLEGALGKVVDPRRPKQIIEAVEASVTERKQIPEGLDYYSFNRFEERVHTFLRSLTADEGAASKVRPLVSGG